MSDIILRKLIREVLREGNNHELGFSLYDKTSRFYSMYEQPAGDDKVISDRNRMVSLIYNSGNKLQFDKIRIISIVNSLNDCIKKEYNVDLNIQIDVTPDDMMNPGEFTYQYSISDDWKRFARRVGYQIYGGAKDVEIWFEPWRSKVDGMTMVHSCFQKATKKFKHNKLVRDNIEPAPESAPFERYLFAPQRTNFPSNEKNNKLESQLLKALKDHFKDNKTISLEIANMMMKLVNQGLYKDILIKPDPSVFLYRGMSVSENFIESLGLDPEIENGEYKVSAVINASRNNKVSSWSYERQVATNFAREGDYSDQGASFDIVLIAKAGDNPDSFIDGEIFLSELSNYFKYDSPESPEFECFGMNNVKLFAVEVWRRSS